MVSLQGRPAPAALEEVKEEDSYLDAVTKEELHGNLEANLTPISGFTDYSPQEHYAFGAMLRKVEAAYAKYGFTHFHPRPLERTSNILKKGGIGKQIFGVSRLASATLTKLAIPFDRTVPFALFVAKNYQSMVFPYKRQDISYSFRGEKPSPGRFCGFYQADVDVVGKNLGIVNDFECIGAMVEALKQLDIGNFTLNLNNIVIPKAMIARAGISKEKEPEALRIIDKMDKTTQEDICQQLADLCPEIKPTVIEALVKKFAFKSTPMDFQLEEGFEPDVHQALKDVQTLHQMLVNSGVPEKSLALCPGMVRGLDYYTGIVFETFVDGLEKFGSIASGGRYSNLVDAFTGEETGIEGVGGSIGLTRLFDVLSRNNLIDPKRSTLAEVLVCFRTQALMQEAVKVAAELRSKGVNTSLYSGNAKKIKKQLTYANGIAVPFTVMVMDEQAFVVKNMNAEKRDKGQQREVDRIGRVFDAYQALKKAS